MAVIVRRTTTALVGLTAITLGIFIAFVAFRQVSAGTVDLLGLVLRVDFAVMDIPTRIGWSVIAAVLFLVGAFLASAGLFRTSNGGLVLLRYDRFPAGGALSISREAVRALVARATLETEGVTSATPHVALRGSGWMIDCDVVVGDDVQLPQLAATARERIQLAVERHTGHPVARLRMHSDLAIAGKRVVR